VVEKDWLVVTHPRQSTTVSEWLHPGCDALLCRFHQENDTLHGFSKGRKTLEPF
jgi:hypothetical protein